MTSTAINMTESTTYNLSENTGPNFKAYVGYPMLQTSSDVEKKNWRKQCPRQEKARHSPKKNVHKIRRCC